MPRTEAVPCVVCRRTGGPMQENTHRPARVRLDRFGIEGVGCYGCYQRILYRSKHGLDPATGERLEARR
jgi:hypothetical protein